MVFGGWEEDGTIKSVHSRAPRLVMEIWRVVGDGEDGNDNGEYMALLQNLFDKLLTTVVIIISNLKLLSYFYVCHQQNRYD